MIIIDLLSLFIYFSECGGATRKRLTRVMRNFSLSDRNWHLFLDNLTNVAINLALKTTIEFSDIYNNLVNVIQNQGIILFDILKLFINCREA